MAALFDVAGDAARAFAVLRDGGIAIVPNDIGYSILGGSPAALRRMPARTGLLRQRQDCVDRGHAPLAPPPRLESNREQTG